MLTESTFSALYKAQQFKTLNDLYNFLGENGLHIPTTKTIQRTKWILILTESKYLKRDDGVEVERVERG